MVVIILSMANRAEWRMVIRKQIQSYNENLTVSDSDHTWTTGSFQRNHLGSRLKAKVEYIKTLTPFLLLFSCEALVPHWEQGRNVA